MNHIRATILSALSATLFLLTSCGGNLACKNSMGGVTCETLTTAYEHRNVTRGGSGDAGAIKHGRTSVPQHSQATEIVKQLALDNNLPIRIPPKIIRIWIAPWEDSDGDLHQAGFIFSEISDKRGRWVFGEKAVTSSQPMLYPLSRQNPEDGRNQPPVPPGHRTNRLMREK
jgi:conjugal transfer pilus assembly protein TraV